MFLSKVHIAWPFAHNPYELHRALWRLFPNRPDDNRDFLFRVERLKKGAGVEILLQSQKLPEGQVQNVHVMATREYVLSLKPEQRLRFCLRGNPVKKIKDQYRKVERSVRVPLIDINEQQQWFKRKLADSAEVHSLIIQPEQALFFRKEKEQQTGKIQPVLFEGVLLVKQEKAFLELVTKGVGPAKSFGCGLLSLAGV